MNNKQIHLVTFSNKEPFITGQKKLNSTYKNAKISTHTMWNNIDIEHTEFYKININFFTKYKNIGFGLFIWKPFIIYQKLLEIPDGDYIYYQDSSRYDFSGLDMDITPVCDFMEQNNIQLLPGFIINKPNYSLIKKECLEYMGYSEDQNFLNSDHYQTSPMIFKKTTDTTNFIKEWLEFCQIPQCIVKNTKFHQCDQAIMNILLDKYNFKGLLETTDKNESKLYSAYWKKMLKYIENNKIH